MKTFEYHMLASTPDDQHGSGKKVTQEDLDELGRKGWELIAVAPSAHPGFHRWVFKREVEA